ncbi:MAG: DUF6056 family protein [Bacteroidota bacterium]
MPKKKTPIIIILLLLASLLLPYLVISFYSHPASDDFFYAARSIDNGIFNTWSADYFEWNGRYTSNLFALINPIAFGSFTIYSLMPMLMILLTFFSVLLFLRSLFQTGIHQKIILFCSLLLTLLLLHNMPDITEGIYWYTGAVTYMSGNILLLLAVTFLLRSKNNSSKTPVHSIVAALFLFLCIGCNEISMLMCVAFLVVLAGIKWITKTKQSTLWLLIPVVVSGSLLVILAPGNEVRGSAYPDAHQFFYSIEMAGMQSLRFLAKAIASAPLIAASLLYLSFHSFLYKKNDLIQKSFYLHPLISALLLFAVFFAGTFPAYWATGVLGQHRTLNVSYFAFLVLWFINLTVWINFLNKRIRKLIRISIQLRALSITVCVASLIITGNGLTVWNDLISGRAASFDSQMQERYQILKKAKNENDTVVQLPLLKDKPETLFVLDITEDPDHWINQGYALYFGLDGKKIGVKK